MEHVMDRISDTREQILATAERLFAEHGVYTVSNRQIAEAAGQRNTAAVGYHFGDKADLIRAIIRKHNGPTEQLRTDMVARITGSTDIRSWVACFVRPTTQHLATLGAPTWYARFSAQVVTEPTLHEIMAEETMHSSSLRRTLDALHACLPELPDDVRAERTDMARQLMVHMVAERERALAEHTRTPRTTWHAAATGLIDAITATGGSPATPTGPAPSSRRALTTRPAPDAPSAHSLTA